MLNNTSSDFELTIRQQPDRARVAGGKEKGTFFNHPLLCPCSARWGNGEIQLDINLSAWWQNGSQSIHLRLSNFASEMKAAI